MVSILSSDVAKAQGSARPGARPWERGGSIDVEALAQWAYGVQLVDRFERAGLHAIEAAVMGYEPRSFSADGVGQLMAINNLGCRVDNGGVFIADAVHPAAYALAVELGMVEQGELVRSHARAGTRPDSWRPPVHRVRPAMWSKPGKEAVVEYQGPGRKGGYCQVLYVWDGAREAWGRKLYQRWWHALDDLAWRLSQRALGFIVRPPAAPIEPWIEKSDADRPISLDERPEAPAPPLGPPGGP